MNKGRAPETNNAVTWQCNRCGAEDPAVDVFDGRCSCGGTSWHGRGIATSPETTARPDIAATLRANADAGQHLCPASWQREAADEIDRLRAALRMIATGRDANGLKCDFPCEIADAALHGRA